MRCTFVAATALLFTFCLGQAIVIAQSKPSSTSTTSTPAKKAPPVKQELLDINTASRAQLEKLPDMPDFMAQRIIENRPYRMKEDLMNKNVIPPSHYKKIADLIIVKPLAKTTTPKK